MIKVGFIQFRVEFGNKGKNFQKIDRLIGNNQVDLLVLPELFNTGYLFSQKEELAQVSETIPEGETTQFLISLAKKTNSTIIAGLAEKANEKFYNSAVVINGEGLLGVYRKIHLFDREKLFFEKGDLPFHVWDIGMAKIGVMICFDWIFPEAARSLALKGAEIICHPSNLVLPYCQNAMVTRCLENLVFAITANRIGKETKGNFSLTFTGKSQITAFNGDVLYRASEDREEVVLLDIDPALARNKKITDQNDIFDDLRPEMYSIK